MQNKDSIHLIPLRESDLEDLKNWGCDAAVRDYFGLDADNGADDFSDRYRCLIGHRDHRLWTIRTETCALIGEIELAHINWRQKHAELKVCIGVQEQRGLGLGTKAIQRVLKIAFTQFDLKYVYLRVYRGNKAALRCYQRLGFKLQGLLRNRYRYDNASTDRDIYLMYISKTDAGQRQHEPRLIDKKETCSL